MLTEGLCPLTCELYVDLLPFFAIQCVSIMLLTVAVCFVDIKSTYKFVKTSVRESKRKAVDSFCMLICLDINYPVVGLHIANR